MFSMTGDISTRLVDTIVNLPKAYETKLKTVQGSMLNETWEILTEFFEEPNRKLAEMLNDDRYLWKDTAFNYRPKTALRKNSSKTNTLKRNYERKKASKPVRKIQVKGISFKEIKSSVPTKETRN